MLPFKCPIPAFHCSIPYVCSLKKAYNALFWGGGPGLWFGGGCGVILNITLFGVLKRVLKNPPFNGQCPKIMRASFSCFSSTTTTSSSTKTPNYTLNMYPLLPGSPQPFSSFFYSNPQFPLLFSDSSTAGDFPLWVLSPNSFFRFLLPTPAHATVHCVPWFK